MPDRKPRAALNSKGTARNPKQGREGESKAKAAAGSCFGVSPVLPGWGWVLAGSRQSLGRRRRGKVSFDCPLMPGRGKRDGCWRTWQGLPGVRLGSRLHKEKREPDGAGEPAKELANHLSGETSSTLPRDLSGYFRPLLLAGIPLFPWKSLTLQRSDRQKSW